MSYGPNDGRDDDRSIYDPEFEAYQRRRLFWEQLAITGVAGLVFVLAVGYAWLTHF